MISNNNRGFTNYMAAYLDVQLGFYPWDHHKVGPPKVMVNVTIHNGMRSSPSNASIHMTDDERFNVLLLAQNDDLLHWGAEQLKGEWVH